MLAAQLITLAALATSPFARQTPHRLSTPVWETLPDSLPLPGSPAGTLTTINGVQIWHAEFNNNAAGTPILFLHGGGGNSLWWGSVVQEMMGHGRRMIVMDTRGQGNSTLDEATFTYDLFAKDAVSLLKSLDVDEAIICGWSDGGNSVLRALANPHQAKFVKAGFLFGANHVNTAVNTTFYQTAVYQQFVKKAKQQYASSQPNGNFTTLAIKLQSLTMRDFKFDPITSNKNIVTSNIMISDGEYEEAIILSEPKAIQDGMVGSQLLIQKGVSHFGPVQDPKLFADTLEQFIASVKI